MAIGGPAANYWGGDRPGANLFANSIVAVDVETGKYKWHFQTVHHDLWDADQPSPPVLVDIRQNGRTVPALAPVGKTGLMFILDRTNGKPIFGVEERPVPKGDVPGEWYSPTQPFPSSRRRSPAWISTKSATWSGPRTRRRSTSRPARSCGTRAGGFYNAGPFTPFLLHEDGAPPRSTIQFPGGTGGVNWGGAAADPRTGFVFVNAHDTSLVGWIEKKKPGGNYGRGTEGADAALRSRQRERTGALLQVHRAAEGRQRPDDRQPAMPATTVGAAGRRQRQHRRHRVADARSASTRTCRKGKQNVGGSGSAGPSVTAGGLVFVGATNDRRFRAFDSKTGKELWSVKLENTVNANPITYQGKNGKQYVAAVATDTVVAFALP